MERDRIQTLEDLPRFSPPGHSGTTNHRLVSAAQGKSFELIHGRIEPGGEAERHCHPDEYQAIYILAGRASVVLGNGEPAACGAGTIVRIPPGLEHEVRSLGPEPLDMLIVYAPPIGAAEPR